MNRSDAEESFATILNLAGLPKPTREYRFHPSRKWRFDFAWPEKMAAVEIEGGVFSGGRHTRGVGFVKDCEKYNSATLLGWRVLRIPSNWVDNGPALELTRALISEEQS